MDLRALRYFLEVAQEENITKAADYLHVTQPTLSRTLMELEQEFGKQLVIRGKRRLSLTQDGLLLRKRAMELIELADKTEAELREREDSVEGDVYIGAGESDGMRVIARICQELRKLHPGIRFRLSTGDGDEVKDRLDKGLVDLGLVFGPVDQAKYNAIPLPFEGIWGVILPADDPLASKPSVEPQDLWDRPLLLSQQALQGGFLQAWLHRELDDLNVCATYTTMLNAVMLTEGGFGCAMVIDGLFNLTNTGLCFRPCIPSLTAGTSVIWKKYQVFSPPAELFLHALIEHFS